MPQISLTIQSDILNQAENRAKEKKLSRSEYLNRLIESGLRMEEYQEQNPASNEDEFDIQNAFKRLEKIAGINMKYIMEADLYIQRNIRISHGDDQLENAKSVVREMASDKSKALINEIE